MPTVKLHYDGWVSLPSSIRQKLGLNSGDRLEADLVNGAIVLRPAVKASSPAPHDEQASNPPAAGVPEILTPQAATPARRKPGRPRKGEAADGLAPAAQPKRPRGRPKAALAPATCAPAGGQKRTMEAAAQRGPAAESGECGSAAAAQPPPSSGQDRGRLPAQAAQSVSQCRGAQAWAGTPTQQASRTSLTRPRYGPSQRSAGTRGPGPAWLMEWQHLSASCMGCPTARSPPGRHPSAALAARLCGQSPGGWCCGRGGHTPSEVH